jgi:disulfide bond formation protein DsbB
MRKLFYLLIWLLLMTALSLVACSGRNQSQSQTGGEAAQANEALAAPSTQGDPLAGKEKFTATCSACHGPAGEGIPGLGKDMKTSQFIAGKTDQELVEFIKVGRDPSDPLNTTGVAMPPKGGNPALNDDDLYDIVSYIRTLRQE